MVRTQWNYMKNNSIMQLAQQMFFENLFEEYVSQKQCEDVLL